MQTFALHLKGCVRYNESEQDVSYYGPILSSYALSKKVFVVRSEYTQPYKTIGTEGIIARKKSRRFLLAFARSLCQRSIALKKLHDSKAERDKEGDEREA